MFLFLFITTIVADCTSCFDDTMYIWGMDENVKQYGLSTCEGILDCTMAICNILYTRNTYIALLQINNATKPNIPLLTQFSHRSASCNEDGFEVFVFSDNGGSQIGCNGLINCGETICEMHTKHPNKTVNMILTPR